MKFKAIVTKFIQYDTIEIEAKDNWDAHNKASELIHGETEYMLENEKTATRIEIS